MRTKSSLLPTDKGEGGQKTGGRDDRSPGGINSKEAPDSNPSLLPTDKGEGGQKTEERDDRSPGGINSKEAPDSNLSLLPTDFTVMNGNVWGWPWPTASHLD